MRLSVLALLFIAVLAISVFAEDADSAAPETSVTRRKQNRENGRDRGHPVTRNHRSARDVEVVNADAAAPIADAIAPAKREAGFNAFVNVAATRKNNGGGRRPASRKPDNRGRERVTRRQNNDNRRGGRTQVTRRG